jgi:hypothetical protein
MVQMMLDRETILKNIREHTEPLEYFQCMWEGGAASFDRVDDWSDIDLQLAVDDDKVGQAVQVVDKCLEKMGRVEAKYVLPQPTSHGHWQAFYRLEKTTPFLLLDLVIMKKSSTNRFSEPEIHGKARIHFDKIGFLKTGPLDQEALSRKLEARKASLRASFELFQPFVLKELNRQNYVEAMGYYNSVTLRPLVELLRIKYCPPRHDFYTRYVYYDLPVDVAKRLERFFYISDPADLRVKHQEAIEWVRTLI